MAKCLLFCTYFIFIMAACKNGSESKPTYNKLDKSDRGILEDAASSKVIDTPLIVSYEVDPSISNIELYWKNDQGELIKSISRLEDYLLSKNKKLTFAMNAGMYLEDHSAQGLFIQNGKIIKPLNIDSGYGNFYLKPNGIFFITKKKKAFVLPTSDFKLINEILFATQSGPMLVIDGKIHSSFSKTGTSLYVRNGVGVLPNGNLLFAISSSPINFYNFASFFKDKKCANALYLDGFVSRAYIPEKNWLQKDGDFGVMIGITELL